MGDRYARRPLSHAEFISRVYRLRELFPGSIITSTARSVSHNAAVGGSQQSKHVLYPLTPVACDLAWSPEPTPEQRVEIDTFAAVIGLYGTYHDGHMHLQALPTGPVPEGYEP